MMQTHGYAVQDASSPLAPFVFSRREPGPHDVHIEILYCGICHTDLHQCRNDWAGSTYPMVPGHEIIGRVKAVGTQVTKLQVGDFAGVGCMV
ncbi:MAG: alcohol dehydrogenase catalytic domain-containing protein, partial [Phycisphaerae bacterium]|nr:alcohol dehydrogenase catalytic domain-containing protein [Phycisphaerae bacterium]